jgi:hypothetical protein
VIQGHEANHPQAIPVQNLDAGLAPAPGGQVRTLPQEHDSGADVRSDAIEIVRTARIRILIGIPLITGFAILSI